MSYVDGLGLKLTWDALLEQFSTDRKLGKKLLFNLVSTYCHPQRYYHNLGHIQLMMTTLDRMKSFTTDFPAIYLATWFHDVIYDPTAHDNEEKSADYAGELLLKLNIPASTLAATQTLILRTKHHEAAADEWDTQIFLDADWAILGEEPSEYHFYTQAIRREFVAFSEADYCRGRTQFLEGILQRDRLYFTPLMFAEKEAIARRNLEQEIKTLSQ
ncbi:MAG: HD domain-containing protein [Chroococcales cyanobacterium]